MRTALNAKLQAAHRHAEPASPATPIAGVQLGDAQPRKAAPSQKSVVSQAARATWPSFLALGIYFALRMQTDALTPSTAPDFYRLTIAPGLLTANALSYLDRSLTLTVGILLIGWLALSRQALQLNALERGVIVKGLVWLILGFAVTVMVPVRSSLYVCFPAIGASLIGVGIGSAIWRSMPSPRRAIAAIALLVLPLAFLPVYRSRNVRTKEEAVLSTRVTSRIRSEISRQPDIQRIVIYDDPNIHPSVASAFNWALPEAVELTAGRPIPVTLVPQAGVTLPAADRGTLQLVLRDGDVVRLGR